MLVTLHWFYRFMVWSTTLELALARSVPVLNMANIADVSDRLSYWEIELTRLEWRLL